ncbi:hypothetical protein Bbelb_289900 [Branchiostoma belcheri]|nr:hypothetical protein Bbelb_289900 [Branchiostoma belcheri]
MASTASGTVGIRKGRYFGTAPDCVWIITNKCGAIGRHPQSALPRLWLNKRKRRPCGVMGVTKVSNFFLVRVGEGGREGYCGGKCCIRLNLLEPPSRSGVGEGGGEDAAPKDNNKHDKRGSELADATPSTS